ncbi:MAG: alpha/beta hydrolase [Bacterioplanes sp.]|nr:alpha/beta hydrolase [Bacterioplanes sp.]
MQFSTFSMNALRAEPRQQMLGKYKVEFQAYSLPENQHKTPVVFLGGAFQSFVSFKSEVELVLTTHPVILADFPSQGSNDQLAPELDMADYADLIAQFLDGQQIEKVMMLGISYGSAMSMLFATAYPERIERLLLSGITCFRRESLITLLEDSLALLDAGNMDAFATTAVCNLLNHSRLQETEVSATYRRLLYRQISRLNDNERARYAQNTQRLLRFEGFTAYPKCPTLVATGEYDNFTLPHENAAVAQQCPNATFAVIENADHLAQFERKEAASALFHGYMCGNDIRHIDGTRVYAPADFQTDDRRLQGRQRPLAQPYYLYDENSGERHIVRIHNINFAGCELEQTSTNLAVGEQNANLYLELPEAGHRYHIRVLTRHKKQLRCLIIQRDLKAADDLLTYLNEHFLMVREQTSKHDVQSLPA